MVLLGFLESENSSKIRPFPNWEIFFNGHDTHMGVQGIIWGARWCGFYFGRLGVMVTGWLFRVFFFFFFFFFFFSFFLSEDNDDKDGVGKDLCPWKLTQSTKRSTADKAIQGNYPAG